MTANHADGCPAIADTRDGCACLLRQTSSTGPASSYPPPRVLPTSVVPAGEDYGAPHDDPCDCDDCREAVAAQPVDAKAWGYAAALDAATEAVAAMRPETDPDIAHVIVSDVLDVIAAVRGGSASDVFPLDDYIPRTRGTEDGDE